MRVLFKDRTGDLCASEVLYMSYYCSANIDGPKGLCLILNTADYYICKDINRFESEEYVREVAKNGFIDLSNHTFFNATDDIRDDYNRDGLNFYM